MIHSFILFYHIYSFIQRPEGSIPSKTYIVFLSGTVGGIGIFSLYKAGNNNKLRTEFQNKQYILSFSKFLCTGVDGVYGTCIVLGMERWYICQLRFAPGWLVQTLPTRSDRVHRKNTSFMDYRPRKYESPQFMPKSPQFMPK